jgi:uncharacterized protein YggE
MEGTSASGLASDLELTNLGRGADMDFHITIKARTVALTLLIMLVVLAAYFVGSTRPDSGAAVAAETDATAETDAPRIAMAGTGEATGVPDQIEFELTVAESAGDVSTALDEAGRTTRRVLAALAELGIDAKDVQTTGLSVRPQYDYSGSGPAVLTGYGATESVSVLVRELSDGGAAITAAVESGGNSVRVHGVRLKIGDVDALLTKARADAVAEAKAKAEQYAEATGSALGSVVSVKEVSARPRAYAERSAYLEFAADGASSVPIRAGSEELKVTVAIVWSLS